MENLLIQGNLVAGVDTEQGGIIRIEKNYVDMQLPPDMPEDKMDNRILKVCLGLQKDYPEEQTIFYDTMKRRGLQERADTVPFQDK